MATTHSVNMGVELLAAATEQVDIKEGNASFLPEMDEWPAPKQIHSFFLVRFRTYEDPQLKAKLEQADKELQRKNQYRFQITEALRAKRAERASLSSEMKPLLTENKKYMTVIDEKRKEMEPLRATNTVAREKSMGLCSSEEELNDLIQATREKVVSNTAMKVVMKANNQKDTMQDQVKVVEDEINALEEELRSASERRDKAFEALNALRKTRDEGYARFYQNRSLLNMAKDLASKKDTKGLEELCNNEVDKFMYRYSNDRTFRDDYEKRVLPSLDNRRLSRDGRMRNPDEKPIIVESPPATKSEAAPLKVIPKQTKEKKAQGEELIKSSEADKRGKAKASGEQWQCS